MKRIKIVVIFFVFVLFSTQVIASEESQYLIWEGTDTVSIEQYRGDAQEVSIPKEINGKPVTRIGGGAFRNYEKLKSINIPESVIEIRWDAFRNCSNLEYIELPESVAKIGESAFYGCSSLKNIKIPQGVTKIEARTFYGCSKLEDVELPKGITEIGKSAFVDCSNLEHIEIPEGVMVINEEAFSGCTNLIDVKLPNTLSVIKKYAFYECNGLKVLKIPDGTKIVEHGAFARCNNLKWVKIPASMQIIDGYMFPQITICGEANSYAEEYAKKYDKKFCVTDSDICIYTEVEKPENYWRDNKEYDVKLIVVNFGVQAMKDVKVTFELPDTMHINNKDMIINFESIGVLEEKQSEFKVNYSPQINKDSVGTNEESINIYMECENTSKQIVNKSLIFDTNYVSADFTMTLGDPYVSGDMFKIGGPSGTKNNYIGFITLEDMYITLDIYNDGYYMHGIDENGYSKATKVQANIKEMGFYAKLDVICTMRPIFDELPNVYIDVNNYSDIPLIVNLFGEGTDLVHITQGGARLDGTFEIEKEEADIYTVKANIKNVGLSTAQNLKVTLSLPKGLEVIDDSSEKVIGSIEKDCEEEIVWKVKVFEVLQNQKVKIGIRVNGDDIEKQFEKEVTFETGAFYKKLPEKYNVIKSLTCTYSPMLYEESEAQGEMATDMEIVTRGGVGTTLTIETYGANFELIDSYSTVIKYENEYNYIKTNIFTDDCMCYRIVTDDSCVLKDINFYI